MAKEIIAVQEDEELDGNYVLGEHVEEHPTYTPFEKGDYRFRVIEYTEGKWDGGKFYKPCTRATLKLELMADDGTNRINRCTAWLPFLKSSEDRIVSFMDSVGLVRKGEKFTLDMLPRCEGREGYCHVSLGEETVDSNGNPIRYNNVQWYLSAEEFAKKRPNAKKQEARALPAKKTDDPFADLSDEDIPF